MQRRPVILIITALLALTVSPACQSDNHEPERESFMGGLRRQPRETNESPAAAREAASAAPRPADPMAPTAAGPAAAPRRPQPRPAAPVTIPDTRVLFFQPEGDLLLVIVNESHTGRATENGRLAISLGNPGRAYKILSNAQMDALIKSMTAAGYDQAATEFVEEDTQYLAKGADDLPRYKGMILVERGTLRTKVLGFRKSSEGDALGARRYQNYVALKALVQKWFGDSSQSEFPVGSVGIPSPPAK